LSGSEEESVPVGLAEEMRRSFLDYAMSVIVARALPDARDGLKPVHRRILYAMHESGYTADKPHRKSARVVGDVMGKYHPHGDSAIYDAMVRMAQSFSLRVPLIDGQGNFGSMDGDPPAQMRYTEVGRAGIRSAFATGRGSIPLRARCEIEEMKGGRQAIIATAIPYQVNKATLIERIADLVRGKLIEGISDLRDESDRDGLRVVIELKRDATPEVVLNQLYRLTQLQTSFPVNMLALVDGRPEQMGLIRALETFIRFREEVIARRSRYRLAKARERGHLLIGLAIAVANIDEVIALIRASADPATARAGLMGRDWPAGDVGALLALIEDERNTVTPEGTVRLTEEQARGILDLRLQRLTGLEREKIAADLAEVGARIREFLEILGSRPRRLEVMADELRAVRAQIDSPRLTQIVDGLADVDDESLIEPGLMVVTLTRDGYVKRTSLETFRAQNRGGRGRSAASTRQDDVVVRSFVAHTHQFVLFFTSRGLAFREKVWQLPEASPTARGRSLRQVLALQEDEQVTAVLPLPQDESFWDGLHLVFATAQGNVRRNRLSDFRNTRAAGLIAMKLEEGDSLIGVAAAREGDDVLLATALGKCIRFHAVAGELRIFAGRDSSGVRGIRLAAGDAVIALAVLRHAEATPAERAAYLRAAAQKRRAAGEEADTGAAAASADEEGDGEATEVVLSPARFTEMEEQEELILTVTEGGFGKRSSAYDFRVTGRGGQGIAAIALNPRTGRRVVASFPIRAEDDVMLVTDGGRLIRSPARQVRLTGRLAQGVMLLRLDEGERVTSCFPVVDATPDEDGPAPADDAPLPPAAGQPHD